MIGELARRVFTRAKAAQSGSPGETDPVIELLRRTDAFLMELEQGIRGDGAAGPRQPRAGLPWGSVAVSRREPGAGLSIVNGGGVL